jgi:solute carrier family 25 carnitine/acylcarnitine transporter 20/29
MPEFDYVNPSYIDYEKDLSSSRTFINNNVIGVVVGMTRAFVGHPFDTIKVKMQTGANVYRSSLSCLRSILRTDGFGGLYRGLGAPIVGNAAISAVHFSVLNVTKEQYGSVIAGGMAGICGAFISSPVEYIRIKMQLAITNHGKPYRGVFDCMHNIILSGRGINPFRLYRGLSITILREGIGYGAFFGSYEHFSPPTGYKLVDDLLRGIICGVALWGSMYPLDVIKSRIQGAMLSQEHVGILSHAATVYKEGGWLGFFRGFEATMIRAIPVNIAIVLCIESIRAYEK